MMERWGEREKGRLGEREKGTAGPQDILVANFI